MYSLLTFHIVYLFGCFFFGFFLHLYHLYVLLFVVSFFLNHSPLPYSCSAAITYFSNTFISLSFYLSYSFPCYSALSACLLSLSTSVSFSFPRCFDIFLSLPLCFILHSSYPLVLYPCILSFSLPKAAITFSNTVVGDIDFVQSLLLPLLLLS